MKYIKLFEELFDYDKDVKDYLIYSIYIDDNRTPGGTEEEIMEDWNLQAYIYDDGTLDVEGFGKDLKEYVDDYGMSRRSLDPIPSSNSPFFATPEKIAEYAKDDIAGFIKDSDQYKDPELVKQVLLILGMDEDEIEALKAAGHFGVI